MKGYYRERAPVYDRVYAYPEREKDLGFLHSHVPAQFDGLDVLEVAAGTGYWTQFICRQAASILATDVTVEALQQIEGRGVTGNVTTRVLDAYRLDQLDRTFSGAFAGLWLSHVPVERRAEFLDALHRQLEPGATVLFLDNSRSQLARLRLSYEDELGNTYQDRVTDSGQTYRVLKNFPIRDELVEATMRRGADHRYQELEHFWLFQYVAR